MLFLYFHVIDKIISIKKSYFIRKDRRNISSKVICHYFGDKGHIRSLCNVWNIMVPNGVITWIPKCPNTNRQESTSWVASYLIDRL